MLGWAFALDEEKLSSGYDERRELVLDTLEAVFALQGSLRDRRGQQLQIDDPLGWRPTRNQREQLLTQLAPVQRRFRMLRGAEGLDL